MSHCVQTEISWSDFEKAIKKLYALPADGITAQKMDALKAITGAATYIHTYYADTHLPCRLANCF